MGFQYDPAFRINDLLAHELLTLAKEGLEARPLPSEEHTGLGRDAVELPRFNAVLASCCWCSRAAGKLHASRPPAAGGILHETAS